MNKLARNFDFLFSTEQVFHGNFILRAVPIQFYEASVLNTGPEFNLMLIVIVFKKQPSKVFFKKRCP